MQGQTPPMPKPSNNELKHYPDASQQQYKIVQPQDTTEKVPTAHYTGYNTLDQDS